MQRKSKKLKGIYKEIAKDDNVSTDEVVSEMQKAINSAWNNADINSRTQWSKLFPKGKPTVDEFICIVASKNINSANL